MPDAKVFKRAHLRGAKAPTPDLPPAGHGRNEEMRRRADALAAEAERRNATTEAAAGPSVTELIDVEPELAQHFNELEVSHQVAGKRYCWVFTGRAGYFIKQKSIIGWEVVQGDMPEARELMGMGGDTTRRLGDVILMRISEERAQRIDAYNENQVRRQRESVAGGLEAAAAKFAGRGVKIHTSLDSLNPRTAEVIAKRAMGQQLAVRALDKSIREGTVPGAPAPR